MASFFDEKEREENNVTKSFNEFRNQVLGKGYNIDGAYGNQCWDGYAKYCQYLGYPYANCTTSGYVKDIWNNRKTNGMLKNFVEVEIMQPGDIAVFKEVKGWTPLSHIAIFVKDLGNGYGLFLGQNQGGANGNFNEVKFPYSATFATAFRPKMFANSSETVLNKIPNDFIKESATFYCNVDKINIRLAPSLKGQLTGDWYENGMTVKYDGYVKREGYVWISWISAKTGNRHWMAVGELNKNGYNTKPYGTFE